MISPVKFFIQTYSKVMTSKKQSKSSSKNYGDASYWQERYQNTKGERFDWLENFNTCFDVLQKYMNGNKQISILNIGCGNATIQDDLYEAGYHNIVNNDISKVCIEQMQKIKKEKEYEKMLYEVMDVRQMSYPNESFDIVLDKSTIDALMCSDEPLISVCQMVDEVYRVLKPNGIYLIISYASPTFRLENLKREHVSFDVNISELKRKSQQGQQLVHYLYVCKKLPMKPLNQQEKTEFYHKIKQLQDIEYPPPKNF